MDAFNYDQDFEQTLVVFRERLPRYWWALHQGCLQAGFTPAQAFALLTTFVLQQNVTIRPDNPPTSSEITE